MPWAILANRYVAALLFSFCLLFGVYWYGHLTGAAKIRAEWNVERAKQAAALAAAEQHARQVEQAAQEAAVKAQQEKRDEIVQLSRRHAALIDGLRDRAARAASGAVSGPAGHAEGQPGCTGAQLSREDAQFLAGEAARADELRAELEACYAQYDRARKLMR